jgi:hypothetical protein
VKNPGNYSFEAVDTIRLDKDIPTRRINVIVRDTWHQVVYMPDTYCGILTRGWNGAFEEYIPNFAPRTWYRTYLSTWKL